MTQPTAGAFGHGTFTWLLGIEDTCVYPPLGAASGPLDEHALTQHDQQWASDLERVALLGATALRYGISWPCVHLGPGKFDWSDLDERLAYATGPLGLTVVADLVHYGCPPWLAGSFADERFPEMLAEFASAFAARYRGLVDHITPVNEPLTTASFCGLRGIWPPYLTGWAGWSAVTMALARGAAAAIGGIRRVNPDAVIVHVEAAFPVETADRALDEQVEHLRRVSYLPTDLLLGRVSPAHEMHDWLIEWGIESQALADLVGKAATIDLLGVNYYPDLSPRSLAMHDGAVVQVSVARGAPGLVQSVRAMAQRYELPLLVTETSIEGSDEVRTSWLQEAAAACTDLRASGVDLRGFTWWPLLDFVDWSFVAGGASVEEFLVPDGAGGGALSVPAPLGDPADGVTAFLRRMGLLRLTESPDGSLQRTETGAAEAFRRLSVATSAGARTDRVTALTIEQ